MAGVYARLFCFDRLVSLDQFLNRPFITIGVVEINKPSPRKILDVAYIDSPTFQFFSSIVRVLNDDLKKIERTRL